MTDEKELTHIDLFSGIGGFTLAAEWAGFRTVVFCEKEKFCQEILKKRFGAIADSEHLWKLQSKRSKQNQWERIGDSPILIPEIRDVDGTKYQGATLLTGGFPCQPFSVAGQRRGKEDDHYLWPEMLRVISEAKPCWVLAENVPGIFHMALDTVLADLEGEGYTTGTFIIPACGLNAPHRRNRVWIVANSRCQYGEGAENKGEFKRPIFEKEDATLLERPIKDDGLGDAPDPSSRGIQGRSISIRQRQSKQATCNIKRSNQYTSDSNSGRIRLHDSGGIKEGSTSRSVWQENWHEIAARFCRVDDGIPDRVHRLKALGNAIVPQIVHFPP